MTSNEKYVVTLTQLQPPNIVDGAPIIMRQLNELQVKIENQQRKINESKMLGSAGARLEEELRQLKLEDQRFNKQLLETKRLLVKTENQRESCMRQVEMLNR